MSRSRIGAERGRRSVAKSKERSVVVMSRSRIGAEREQWSSWRDESLPGTSVVWRKLVAMLGYHTLISANRSIARHVATLVYRSRRQVRSPTFS